MLCKNCGLEMRLDDIDMHGKGNKDKYWICDLCNIGCCEEIRLNKESCFVWQEE